MSLGPSVFFGVETQVKRVNPFPTLPLPHPILLKDAEVSVEGDGKFLSGILLWDERQDSFIFFPSLAGFRECFQRSLIGGRHTANAVLN